VDECKSLIGGTYDGLDDKIKHPLAGGSRLIVSKAEFKACLLSALDTKNVMSRFQTLLSISTCDSTLWTPRSTPSLSLKTWR